MDATLADVSADWARLWVLTALYLALAIASRRFIAQGGTADAQGA
jgi:hypothetical protein